MRTIMFKDLTPILSTLRRHRIAAGLIVLEVALTCAIVTNALHLIQTRVDALRADSGLAESELVVLNLRDSKPTPRERVAAVVAASRWSPTARDCASSRRSTGRTSS
jgi:putative ABC transport system permease protein